MQLLARSRPLAVAAGVLVGLALIPGLPKLSFLFVAAVLGGAAYANRRRQPSRAGRSRSAVADARRRSRPSCPSIRSASKWATRSSRSSTRSRAARCSAACARSAGRSPTETGMVVPPVHVADNLQLGPRTYAILVKGVEVARGELFTDRLLAINPGTVQRAARRRRRRASRRSACPPSGSRRTSATRRSPPATPSSIRRRRSRRTCRKSSARSCRTCSRGSRRRNWSIASAQTSPKLVEELVPKVAPVGDVQRVLRQLLRERVPVRDLTTILEAMADASAVSKDPDVVVEAVRAALGRSICRAYQTRERRPARHRTVAGARGRAGRVAHADRSRRGAGARPDARPDAGRPAGRSARPRRPGTTCALVLADTASAPVAPVLAGAAAHRGAVAQRGARRRCGWCRWPPWIDMHVKRLYRPTVREALAAARQELGPGALVLSTELVPAPGWRGWMGQRVVRLTAAAERPVEEPPRRRREVSDDRPAVPARRHRAADRAAAGVVARLQRGRPRAGPGRSRSRPHDRRPNAAAVRRGAAPRARRRTRSHSRRRRRATRGTKCSSALPAWARRRRSPRLPRRSAPARAGRSAWSRPTRFAPAPSSSCAATRRSSARRSASRAAPPNSTQALAATRQTALVDTAGRSPADPALTESVRRARRNAATCARISCWPPTRRPPPRGASSIATRRCKPSRVVITKLDEADSVHAAVRRACASAACRCRISRPASACPRICSARRRPVSRPRSCASRRWRRDRVTDRVGRRRGRRRPASPSRAARAASARRASPSISPSRMARLGHRVGMLDADFALGNVDVLLGLTPEQHLGAVLDGARAIDDDHARRPVGRPRHSRRQRRARADRARRRAVGAARRRRCDDAGRDLDFLLFDTATGISDNVLDVIGLADYVARRDVVRPGGRRRRLRRDQAHHRQRRRRSRSASSSTPRATPTRRSWCSARSRTRPSGSSAARSATTATCSRTGRVQGLAARADAASSAASRRARRAAASAGWRAGWRRRGRPAPVRGAAPAGGPIVRGRCDRRRRRDAHESGRRRRTRPRATQLVMAHVDLVKSMAQPARPAPAVAGRGLRARQRRRARPDRRGQPLSAVARRAVRRVRAPPHSRRDARRAARPRLGAALGSQAAAPGRRRHRAAAARARPRARGARKSRPTLGIYRRAVRPDARRAADGRAGGGPRAPTTARRGQPARARDRARRRAVRAARAPRAAAPARATRWPSCPSASGRFSRCPTRRS